MIAPMRVLSAYLLIVSNIMIILFLHRKILNSIAESMFILLAIIFAFQILRALNKNSTMAWPALILFLSMSLANSVYLFVMTQNITAFLATIIINLFGMLMSLIWALEGQ